MREVGCSCKTDRRAQNKTGFSSANPFPRQLREGQESAELGSVPRVVGEPRKSGGGKAAWMSWNWWVVMCKGFVYVQAALGECGGFL